MVFPSENITVIYNIRLLCSELLVSSYKRAFDHEQSFSNLGVFPLLPPADSFPLPAESDLGCDGTVSVVTCGTSMLISVGPELLLS